MTMIPLLPLAEAHAVLEQEDQLAEYGAEAYELYDAEAEVEQDRRLEVANFMVRALDGLRVRSVYEDGSFELFGAAVIPEFIPGLIPSRQFFAAPADDDIPF